MKFGDPEINWNKLLENTKFQPHILPEFFAFNTSLPLARDTKLCPFYFEPTHEYEAKSFLTNSGPGRLVMKRLMDIL